jgi:hypothetical protein
LDRYSDIHAKSVNSSSPLILIVRIMKSFLGHYFLKGGFRAGRAGFYLAAQMALYHLLLSMKSYERECCLTIPSIEEKNNEMRDLLLKDLQP